MRWDEAGNRIPPAKPPSRIEIIRPALERYLQSLPDDSRVYLISFNDGIVSQEPFLLSQPGRRQAMLNWAADLNPPSDSKTHLWTTLRKALQQTRVYAHESKGNWVTIRVLTDGENDHPGSDLTLTKVLDEFPEIAQGRMIPDLVLLGSLKQEFRIPIEREARAGRIVLIEPRKMEDAFPPVIKWSPDPIMAGQKTTFFDNSKGTFQNYRWLVDGKEVGQDRSFELASAKPGPATVRVEVRRKDGSRDAAQRTIEIVTEPVRAGLYVPTTAIVGQPVEMIARATGKIASYAWVVDGKNMSTTAEYRHTFEAPGPHQIQLTVGDALGNTDAATRSITVEPKPPPPATPVASFKVVNVELKATDPIQFMNESTGVFDRQHWDFAGEGSSAERNPVFAFGTPGPKPTVLTVTGPGGSNTFSEVLNVLPKFKKPSVSFTAKPHSGTLPLEVHFQAHIEGDCDTVTWNFDDGSSSRESAPIHVYTNASVFHPRVEVGHSPSGLKTEASGELTIHVRKPLPRSFWLVPAGAILLLIAGLGIWAHNRHWEPLFGRLEWEYQGQRGDATLHGRRFPLAQLAIPEWVPQSAFFIRKDRGTVKICAMDRDGVDLPVGEEAQLDGAVFKYTDFC